MGTACAARHPGGRARISYLPAGGWGCPSAFPICASASWKVERSGSRPWLKKSTCCGARRPRRESLQSYRGEMSPMEQWHRQFFVTSFFAEDEVELRHTLGVRNMMWGSDFPHVEGTYPNSRQHLAKLSPGSERRGRGDCGNECCPRDELRCGKTGGEPPPQRFPGRLTTDNSASCLGGGRGCAK